MRNKGEKKVAPLKLFFRANKGLGHVKFSSKCSFRRLNATVTRPVKTCTWRLTCALQREAPSHLAHFLLQNIMLVVGQHMTHQQQKKHSGDSGRVHRHHWGRVSVCAVLFSSLLLVEVRAARARSLWITLLCDEEIEAIYMQSRRRPARSRRLELGSPPITA